MACNLRVYMRYVLPSLRLLGWLTLLTGIIYPLVITGIGYLTLLHKAEGSLLYVNDKVVGSALIGQKFENPKYFWPRPSAHNYDALSSGGSNYGPTSKDLKKAMDERQAVLMKAHSIVNTNEIPSELLFASGSGLDPHISPKAAMFQVKRVAKARNLDTKEGYKTLINLIHTQTDKAFLGFIGEPCVNVLKLNIALDQLEKKQS
jgi:K+-transporting ATPase ATPase C chain